MDFERLLLRRFEGVTGIEIFAIPLALIMGLSRDSLKVSEMLQPRAISKWGLMLMLILGIPLAGCSLGGKELDIVGRPIESFSLPGISKASYEDDAIWYHDRGHNSLMRFDAGQKKLVAYARSQIPAGSFHAVIADSGNRFVIEVGNQSLFVHRFPPIHGNEDNPVAGSLIASRPVGMNGEPRGVAYDPSTRVIVFYDSFGTIAILRLAEDGSVLGSFVGGSGVSADDAVSAGDLDGKGSLVLALQSGKIVVVNIDQTLSDQEMRYIEVAFADDRSKAMTWLAPVPGTSWVFAANDNEALLFSTDRAAEDPVVSRIIGGGEITSWDQIVGWLPKKGLYPHIFLQSSGEVNLLYPEVVLTEGGSVEGLIRTRAFTPLDIGVVPIVDSVLDPAFPAERAATGTAELSSAANISVLRRRANDDLAELVRVRLGDLYVSESLTMSTNLQMTFTKDWLLGWKHGGLGYVEGKAQKDFSDFIEKGFMFDWLLESR